MKEGLGHVQNQIRTMRADMTGRLSQCLEQWSGELANGDSPRPDDKFVDQAVLLSTVREALIKAETVLARAKAETKLARQLDMEANLADGAIGYE